MLKIKSNRKTAFTLAETLITVVILGILAAILVPNLIKNQVENANRTKVKKAMAAYEKAINIMIIENDIKSTEALRELGEEETCKYTREYFKTIQDGSNNCIFKTADRVWWDITDITNPLISLKDEITDANVAAIANNALSLNADTTSFALIGRFDDIGTLRVNDNAYEQGLENNLTNQAYMIKLWHFVNNNDDFSAKEQFAACNSTGASTCKITTKKGTTTYTKMSVEHDISLTFNCYYNQETNSADCDGGHISATPAGDYWISENLGVISESEAKSDETCAKSPYKRCSTNGDYYEAAKQKCENLGGHMPTYAERHIPYSKGLIANPVGKFWGAETYGTYYKLTSVQGSYGSINNSSVSKTIELICVGD